MLRRCQAAKRQRERRSRPGIRQKHAAAERDRRARPPQQLPRPRPEATPKRAWSRSKNNSGSFCDRPGCYENPRASCRCPARYCGNECRQAVRRVRDRERKWFSRNTVAGRYKRRLEYQTQRARRAIQLGDRTSHHRPLGNDGSHSVVNYRDSDQATLTCRLKEIPGDDRETSTSTGPRAPPAS